MRLSIKVLSALLLLTVAASAQPTEPPPATEPAAEPATEPAAPTTEPAAPEPALPAPPENPPPREEKPVDPKEQGGRAALAERFLQMAKISLQLRAITGSMLQQSAVLIEAAARENPTEPRILRMLIEARMQLADDEAGRAAARKAIVDYLNLLAPQQQSDVVAKAKLIDLNARDLQTADKRIDYLSKLVDADIESELRSYAAIQLARTYMDRGQQAQIDDALDRAIKLNPLNLDALRMQYARLGPSATDAQHLALLLQMLRSNPAQPDVMALIAHELSDNGLIEQALGWYNGSFELSNVMGLGLNMSDWTDYAAAVLVGGQERDAAGAAARVLKADPGNADAAFIKLLAQRRTGQPEEIKAAEAETQDAVLTRIETMHAALNNAQPAPATQPLDVVNGYFAPDVAKLKEGADAGLASGYIGGLARLAWYQIYFKRAPDAATAPIDALRNLLGESDPTVTRLEGWQFLMQGKNDEARVKLSAVAERDPLSKLGMIVIAEKESGGAEMRKPIAPEAIDPRKPGKQDESGPIADLQRLAGDNASGVTGAILTDALRERGVVFAPSPVAEMLRQELDKFPREFLNILDQPSTFYKITAEPLSVSHNFGEPILARVTILNLSDYDLTLNSSGAIKPDLWFDVKLTGVMQQALSGVSYDRMGQQMVLKAKGGQASQITRLDDGMLAQALSSQPIIAVPMQFSVFTNPSPRSGGVVPGPAGYRVQFNRVIERAGTPVGASQTQQRLLAQLATGTPEERIRTAEFIATMVAGMSDPKGPDQVRQLAAQFFDALQRIRAVHDSPSVHAWETFMLARLSAETQREQLLSELLRSADWDARMLGLRLLQNYSPDRQKMIAGKFAQADPDELVRRFAASIVETADLPPPTTQPAGEGAATQPASPQSP